MVNEWLYKFENMTLNVRPNLEEKHHNTKLRH